MGRYVEDGAWDRDLVLLRAPLEGRDVELLIETDFNVDPYPVVKVNKLKIKDLVGFRLGDAEWKWSATPPKASESLPQLYVSGLIRTLRGWQKGMAEAAKC